MSELANNKSIRKEVQDLGETLGITPNGKTNQQKIRSIGEQASDGTYATKEYVNTLMSGALKRSIVTTLPTEDIDTNTIYMVLDQSASQQGNVYNEYLYINEAWELIGTTEAQTNHLYKNTVTLYSVGAYEVYLEILTPTPTEFTKTSILEFLNDNDYCHDGNFVRGKEHIATGYEYSSNTYHEVTGVIYNKGNGNIEVLEITTSGFNRYSLLTISNITNHIVQIF